MVKNLVFMLAFISPISVYSAGFDCSKSKTKVEKMICGDTELSNLDSELKSVFLEARDNVGAGWDAETGKSIDPVGENNSKWLKNVRNKCSSVSCLKKAYESHIVNLKNLFVNGN